MPGTDSYVPMSGVPTSRPALVPPQARMPRRCIGHYPIGTPVMTDRAVWLYHKSSLTGASGAPGTIPTLDPKRAADFISLMRHRRKAERSRERDGREH